MRKISSVSIFIACFIVFTSFLCASGAENEISNANNCFAMKLFARYSSGTGNIFFSPYSISTALAMTYEGAKGKTAEEMRSVLCFPDDIEALRNGEKGIYDLLNAKGKKYELSAANALWAQDRYKFLDGYLKTIDGFYAGKVTNLDFVHNAEGSRVTINAWVSDNTSGKIKDLLPAGIIDSSTRLVLTNAVYFNGKWMKKFDPKDTEKDDFKLDDGKTIKVDMMYELIHGAIDKTFCKGVKVLGLPYEGNGLTMYIFLPDKGKMDVLEKNMTMDKISAWRSKISRGKFGGEVEVFLPKFKFETKYSMKDDLTAMGMPAAFSDTADFSGMTGTQELCIAAVIHQAYIDVKEEGTEAAGATGVVMAPKSAPPGPQAEPEIFRADHPFIFMIMENKTGDILFMGRLNDLGKDN